MKCPMCEKGTLKKAKIKETMFGEYLGEYPGQKCSQCQETFFDSDTMQKIEQAAKKKGIWGLGCKTKITRTGNSLAVRIPKKIVDYLHLAEGTEAYIHPEGSKLVVEARP